MMACRGKTPAPAELETPQASPAVVPAAFSAPSPSASHLEREGLSIAFELRAAGDATGTPAMAHSDATAVITVIDAVTGAPVRGLRPLAWMSRRGEDGALDDRACRAKIKGFMAGFLSEVPDVDMNGYLVWTLNDDNTLSVINPQIAFSKTKLRNLVSLSGRAADWALHPDRSRIYVTLPDKGTVAVVDTRRSLALANVPVGERPVRLAVAPDGETVWVGNDGDGTVSVIDTRSNRVVKTLRAGAGHHEVVFAGEGRAAWITGRDGEVVTVIDTATLDVVGEVEVGQGAVSIAASPSARALYVANEARGEVVIVDAARRSVGGRIALKRGLSQVRFEPGGRFAFALNPRANEVAILDTATGGVAHTLGGLETPDAIAFTDAFAYVRKLGASSVSLVDLHALGERGEPAVIGVQVGQKTPASAGDPGLAAPLAPTPEGNGVLVASPADKALFFYVEGMMAPIGTLQNYGREPRAALVVDRRLSEVGPGVYATTVRLKGHGLYDVELLFDRPRVAACLEHTVAAPASGADGEGRPRPSFEALFDASVPLAAAAPATLRFRLTERPSPSPPQPIDAKQVDVLVARFPGSWRWQGAPQAEGDGVYSVTFTPPAPGRYRLLVGIPSKGVRLGELPAVDLGVTSDRAVLGKPGIGSRQGGGSP